MDIDKITFVAQIVNLIVLIWLLKRFLYKPIIQAVDKRQSAILKKLPMQMLNIKNGRKLLKNSVKKN